MKMMIKNNLSASKLFKEMFLKNLLASCKMSSANDDVIMESIKDKGLITLNRPKQLNALNLSMVKKILPTLIKWETEKTAVLVKGSGEKSFCSGADVKSIVIANRKGDKLGQEFFKLEYTMNGVIGTYKIPYIAFIDGITMGGGVGLSVHGQYRIATERTVLAMPEMQIGLFPDVGTSYVYSRFPGKLGLYLALTGYRLMGYDTLAVGIATHYVSSDCLPDLQSKLLGSKNEGEIKEIMNEFSDSEKGNFSLSPHVQKIDVYFAADTVEGIIKNLKEDNSKWARSTVKLLLQMSPTSMKVAKELLERASKMPLCDCLQMEYNLAYNISGELVPPINHIYILSISSEVTKGVRALLIDKDKSPKWNPPTLEEVTSSLVELHFKSAPGQLDLKNRYM